MPGAGTIWSAGCADWERRKFVRNLSLRERTHCAGNRDREDCIPDHVAHRPRQIMNVGAPPSARGWRAPKKYLCVVSD